MNERNDCSSKIPPVPKWAQEWFEMKVAAGLSVASLERYSADLRAFNLNLSTSTLQEIRHRQAELAAHYSKAVQRNIAIILKSVLRELGREDDAERLSLPNHAESRVVVYSKDDIELILKTCRTLRDRLLIEVLIGTGARRGELFNMKIKDVQFDEHSPIIYLHGKTGTRTRRLFYSKSDLLAYVSVHPDRNNPEAKFWVNQYGRALSYGGFWRAVHRVGLRALHRQIFPHGFRHTAATREASQFTDREMMIRYGWNRADMVGIYAHLSARDVDDKELALHGLKNEQGRQCLNCNQQNPSTATYCMKCGQILPRTTGGEQHEREN